MSTDRAPYVPTLAKFLATAAAVACAAATHATEIHTVAFVASTDLQPFVYGKTFVIGEINDGNVSDAPPYNGFAANGIPTGRITFTFAQTWDLTTLTIWNDINVWNEGVRSFKLSFEDAAGAALGTTATYSAVSQYAPQSYSFATVAGVKRVHMDVLSSNTQIELREVTFNGTAAAVPEPGAWALMGLGLVGVAAAVRRRQG